jgi:cell division protein FtsZ
MEDQNLEPMRFNLPKEESSIIKVIGVGGGGSNAVNYMYEQGIKGVDFIVCNTDNQALDASPVPLKIQLGATLTEGRGAGSKPEVGRNAAVETLDDVKEMLNDKTTMVFITAGMGGGTGTGAAPIIARAAKEMGILTVGIVTIPFAFEGRKRSTQAEDGLREMRDAVDTLLVIKNDRLRELFGNLPLKKAFDHADEVLCTAAKGIAEVITLTGEINVDMNDVNTVMRESGVAIMGSGKASGEGRALKAVEEALESPLLNDNDITGANFVLLNITYGGEEVLMDEISEITDYIQDRAGQSAEVIWGYGADETLSEDLCVTVIATGFQPNQIDAGLPKPEPKFTKHTLPDTNVKEVTRKVENPTAVEPSKQLEEEDKAEPFLISGTPETPAAEVEEHEEDTNENDTEWVVLDRSEVAQNTLFTESADAEETKPAPEETKQDKLEFNADTPAEDEFKKPTYYTLDGENVNKEDLLSTEPTDKIQFTDQESPKEHEEIKVEHEQEETQPSREEMAERNRIREQRIREISMKLKTPSGLSELENEPAYLRRNVKLDNTPHSSESSVSRFSLGEEEDENGNKRAQLRDGNSFLSDNVD